MSLTLLFNQGGTPATVGASPGVANFTSAAGKATGAASVGAAAGTANFTSGPGKATGRATVGAAPGSASFTSGPGKATGSAVVGSMPGTATFTYPPGHAIGDSQAAATVGAVPGAAVFSSPPGAAGVQVRSRGGGIPYETKAIPVRRPPVVIWPAVRIVKEASVGAAPGILRAGCAAGEAVVAAVVGAAAGTMETGTAGGTAAGAALVLAWPAALALSAGPGAATGAATARASEALARFLGAPGLAAGAALARSIVGGVRAHGAGAAGRGAALVSSASAGARLEGAAGRAGGEALALAKRGQFHAHSDATCQRGVRGPSWEEIASVLLLTDDEQIAKARIVSLNRDRHLVVHARRMMQDNIGAFLAHLGERLAMLARGPRDGASTTASVALPTAGSGLLRAGTPKTTVGVSARGGQRAAYTKAEEGKDDPIVAAADATDYAPVGHVAGPQLRAVAKDAARLGLDQVDADLDRLLSQVNERATAWASERAGELVTEIGDTTRARVRELVQRAEAEGWSNDKLADELAGDGVFSESRAEMIARTETADADVQGNLIGWKESGLVSGKEWKSSEDACEDCAALDGEQAEIDGDFAEGDPPLHPNCRCDVLPVLAEE